MVIVPNTFDALLVHEQSADRHREVAGERALLYLQLSNGSIELVLLEPFDDARAKVLRSIAERLVSYTNAGVHLHNVYLIADGRSIVAICMAVFRKLRDNKSCSSLDGGIRIEIFHPLRKHLIEIPRTVVIALGQDME